MGQTWVISILFSTDKWFNTRLTVPGNEPSTQDNDIFLYVSYGTAGFVQTRADVLGSGHTPSQCSKGHPLVEYFKMILHSSDSDFLKYINNK